MTSNNGSVLTDYTNPLWRLILRADTRPTRFMLAFAGALWAVGLALPGNTLSRPVYYYMEVAGTTFGLSANETEVIWALAWALYAAGMLAYTFLPVPRRLALSLNLFGLALWGFCSLSIAATLTYPYPAGTAPGFALLLAAFWVFTRTGIDQSDV